MLRLPTGMLQYLFQAPPHSSGMHHHQCNNSHQHNSSMTMMNCLRC